MNIFDDIAGEAARADHQERHIGLIKSGEFVRQGDVYLTAIDNVDDSRKALLASMSKRIGWEDVRFDELGSVTANRQLAPGATQGSRHMVSMDSMPVVDIHAPLSSTHPCIGPVLVASGRWTLEHPEHATVHMPEGIYQVTFQRDFGFEEARRVAD